jgi:hypothetical protein
MLIKLNNKVADLPYLYWLTLKYIYEKDTLKPAEIHLMMDSVVKWTKKLDKTEEEQYAINTICYLLNQEENGKYDERKENFKRHGISWKQFHKLDKTFGRPN